MPRHVYVSIDIAAPPERVWELTQTPAAHERWDVRFSRITYLPRENEAAQRFEYATRLGFGLHIVGWGETAGTHDADGTRTSALRFGSDDPKSLITVGSGYWRYEPLAGGRATRFTTSFDYGVRFGASGRTLDRVVFRPLMGRATAWGFDRLRLWAEGGVTPEDALRNAVLYTVTRGTLSLVWLYHGLVPKLILLHSDERTLMIAGGVPSDFAAAAVRGLGVLEITAALVLLIFWHARWPLWVTVFVMACALSMVLVTAPRYAGGAFNVVTINVSAAALAGVALLVRNVPASARCRRRPERERAA